MHYCVFISCHISHAQQNIQCSLNCLKHTFPLGNRIYPENLKVVFVVVVVVVVVTFFAC